VLTDITISGDAGLELYALQPGALPDLFGGDELVVFGRYRGRADGERNITVRGRRNGREERFSTALAGDGSTGAEYITQLWAARRAAALSRELRLHGQSSEVMNELRTLALRYGILTEYTSYLVQEPNMVANRTNDQMRRMQAPAPAAQNGAEAVGRAREEARASSTMSLDAITMTGSGRADSAAVGFGAKAALTKRVGGRMFVMRDNTWTDLRYADSARIVAVAPFSDAYFALLKALPELVGSASLQPAVVVAGGRVAIKIESGGKSTWGAGELEEIVRKFRG
jgi:Ca-activated chloride channel homolog